ncbi:MAG: NADP-dependent oxidoreductase [Rhodocyclales bacterium]|nr:NADP-dependent oxidoreductase [Rhodocyclales bacterium]
MQACYIQRYGNAEVVRVGELPVPTPGPGELLFRMEAASVNPVDFKIRMGMLRALQAYRMPAILGNDAAGVVTALGPGVAGFKLGDRVAARLDKARMGAFAEFVVARPQHLAKIPEGVSYAQAAAVALAGLTAWQCLTEVLCIAPGERVLIHAGGGGVGHLAIQLAKGLGAHVTTTASATSHDWLRELGADACVDYRDTDFTHECAPFDAVLDAMGGDTLLRSIGHTRRGGRVVSIGDMPTPEVATAFGKPWLVPVFWLLSRRPRAAARAQGVAYRYWFMREDGAQLARLLDKLARGELQLRIEREFTLAQAPDALRLIAAGRVRGKLVVRP